MFEFSKCHQFFGVFRYLTRSVFVFELIHFQNSVWSKSGGAHSRNSGSAEVHTFFPKPPIKWGFESSFAHLSFQSLDGSLYVRFFLEPMICFDHKKRLTFPPNCPKLTDSHSSDILLPLVDADLHVCTQAPLLNLPNRKQSWSWRQLCVATTFDCADLFLIVSPGTKGHVIKIMRHKFCFCVVSGIFVADTKIKWVFS